MKVLFFSVRNHHRNYFRKLSEQANHTGLYQATLVRHRHYWFKNLWPVFRTHPELDEVVRLKLKEKIQDTADYRLAVFQLWLNKFWLSLSCRFLYRAYFNGLRQQSPDVVVSWSGMMWHQRILVLAARSQDIPTLLMENGPLPDTTTIDPRGVNFINSLPRQLQDYSLHQTPPGQLPDALIPRQTNKRKSAAAQQQQPLPARYVFVPFQVDADRQILCFSPWIANMRDFYKILESSVGSLPADISLVIKEHPSCPKNFSDLHLHHPRIHFANEQNTQHLIEQAELVVTINSSVGLEALLFDKPVAVLGQAFYNLEGLCLSAQNQQQLEKIFLRPEEWQASAYGKSYLSYLYNHYLVKGSWKQATKDHLHAMNQKIVELCR
ncbi:hypothetical protein [Oceanobacter mangrovi]|uniref:capsular polysaccharide export protein, LipB/KpsS family n=1 Tax=Oceanobacter mangrovi TaxID=2862510 RepID=UPI001C8D2528|nr:hypothetical protein [Oceanobacter mangrovi]